MLFRICDGGDSAFVGTWNVNGRDATQKLDPWLKVEGETQPDIYVLW